MSAGEIGQLWFLSPNPAVANFASGYQYIVGVVFLAAFPVTILARTVATSALALLCCKHSSMPGKHNRVTNLHHDNGVAHTVWQHATLHVVLASCTAVLVLAAC